LERSTEMVKRTYKSAKITGHTSMICRLTGVINSVVLWWLYSEVELKSLASLDYIKLLNAPRHTKAGNAEDLSRLWISLVPDDSFCLFSFFLSYIFLCQKLFEKW